MPTISATSPHMRDILEPASNEQVRATYLERQMKEMDSVKLPSDIPSLEDGASIGPESLPNRIQNFFQEKRDKRKQEWESHRVTLEKMKESKESNVINKVKKKEMPCMLRCYKIWKEPELL